MAQVIVVEDLAREQVRGQGGQSMRVLQVLHGLERLGHEVLFLELLPSRPDAETERYFREVIDAWWRPDGAALIAEDTLSSVYGISADDVRRRARDVEAVITLAAHYRPGPWPLIEKVRPRTLFEPDPGYTHVWASQGSPEAIFGSQDIYFTDGSLVGTSRSPIPTVGVQWLPLCGTRSSWTGGSLPVRSRVIDSRPSPIGEATVTWSSTAS